MVPKLYFINKNGDNKTISCLILSNGAWFAKYQDSYITFEGKKRLIRRFEDAMQGRGYTRVNTLKIPEEFRK